MSITPFGISEKDKLPHIFDPFYSTKESGTGLGLAIAHTIIEKHKGRIVVKSERGSGACFVVTLPSQPITICA